MARTHGTVGGGRNQGNSRIDVDGLVALLREVHAENPVVEDAFTTPEFAEQIGCSISTGARRLNEYQRQGKVRRVWTRRTDAANRELIVRGWQYVNKDSRPRNSSRQQKEKRQCR